MSFKTRDAKVDDAEVILDLSKELCAYLKVSVTEVENTTVAEIDLDGNSSQAESGSTCHSKVVGYALYSNGYTTWKGRRICLDDIFVQPEHRGIGIGTAFFKRLGEIALEKNCRELMFVCLDWNQSAKDFYARIGAEERPEQRQFVFKNK